MAYTPPPDQLALGNRLISAISHTEVHQLFHVPPMNEFIPGRPDSYQLESLLDPTNPDRLWRQHEEFSEARVRAEHC